MIRVDISVMPGLNLIPIEKVTRLLVPVLSPPPLPVYVAKQRSMQQPNWRGCVSDSDD